MFIMSFFLKKLREIIVVLFTTHPRNSNTFQIRKNVNSAILLKLLNDLVS